ncbi:hypothetical protein [Lunatibacter salilacus]|uniref:hypothetical protein n=1 Tax=Lunatibacter salilacus TaxID=2483804 RepID=UPI00131B3D8E|nr:hypothetical protein [Lunatibacter salilacus]
MIVFGACTAEYELPLQADGNLSFQITESYVGNERSRKLETPVQGVSHVVLTILNEDGTPTAVDGKSLPTLTFGEELMIEDIRLPAGSYQLSTFYLTDSSGNILYATPLEGSDFGEYLSEPLPISFEISTNGTESLGLEIISTAAQKPESFGFEAGMAGFRETFYFFMSVVREMVDEYMEFLPAELTISNGPYSQTQYLTGKLNRIVLPKEPGIFEFLVEYGPYFSFEQSFSTDSLSQFSTTPLIIELTKNPYVGGPFNGRLEISTQSEVDSFAQFGYESIFGSLILRQTDQDIDDPITDLSGLKTVNYINGSLVIADNPLLQTLNGLDSINVITGSLIIQNNISLETCTPIIGLSELKELKLIGNPSLSNFDGFQTSAPTVKSLFIEQMEHFESLQDLGEFHTLSEVSIIGNPNLHQLNFIFPESVRIGAVIVEDNLSLRNFGGMDGGAFHQISALLLKNNPKLAHLNGLLTEEGKVSSTFALNGNSTLESFAPIKFDTYVNTVEVHDNESLLDLNPMEGIYMVAKYISVVNNPRITSLKGLNLMSLIHYSYPGLADPPFLIRIADNKSLTDFCPMSKEIRRHDRQKWVQISGNAFNPSHSDLLNGVCKQ